MPAVVIGMAGKWAFNNDYGLINDLVRRFVPGFELHWLINTGTARAAVIALDLWKDLPFFAILILSGLQFISSDIYEAAKVDGANAVKSFFYITLPLMKSAIASVLMLGFIYTFKAFDLQFVMTSGGPLNATDVLGTYSYMLSFTQYEFSLGSATAMVLFCCLFVIGLFYLRMISKEDD